MTTSLSRSDTPLVSAVIPTRGRPDLLASAVRSALRQTWPRMEIVVVVDGPDAVTMARLASFADRRVRVLELDLPRGASEARNTGVRAALGEWIAFLDDDDEWLPEKIERQMAVALAMRDWFPVVSTRAIARSPSISRILPEEPYRPPQAIAEFLFCRERPGAGGVMQCSTLLAPRELLLAIPFRCGLPMHQDWDWLIRVGSYEGVGFSMVREPLTVWRVEDGRTTVGRSPDWRFSLAWIRGMRPLISRRAFAWFVAIECAWRARASHAGPFAWLRLLRALLRPAPEPACVLHFVFFSLVPGKARRLLRDFMLRHRSSDAVTSGLRLVYERRAGEPVLRKSS